MQHNPHPKQDLNCTTVQLLHIRSFTCVLPHKSAEYRQCLSSLNYGIPPWDKLSHLFFISPLHMVYVQTCTKVTCNEACKHTLQTALKGCWSWSRVQLRAYLHVSHRFSQGYTITPGDNKVLWDCQLWQMTDSPIFYHNGSILFLPITTFQSDNNITNR